MEMAEAVTQMISTVGFPIAACVGLFYLYNKTVKDLTLVLAKIDQTNQMILDYVKDGEKDA